jgi:hypothetical protein
MAGAEFVIWLLGDLAAMAALAPEPTASSTEGGRKHRNLEADGGGAGETRRAFLQGIDRSSGPAGSPRD